jgi:hypothetical protein
MRLNRPNRCQKITAGDAAGYIRRMETNPFSTRFVRPGAAPYLFPAGQSAGALVKRLAELGWTAQIVGPHGSGKSTLLHTLMPAIQAEGRSPTLITLHDGQRRLSAAAWSAVKVGAPALLIVDGYEQLGRWTRARLRLACRRRGTGLVVTTHRPARLPILYRTTTCIDATRGIVRRLLAHSDSPITDDDIARCFETSGGNVRETLFALYDLAERPPSQPSPETGREPEGRF